jgi:hypothetical protein
MVNLRLPANYFGRQATFMWRDRTAASWQSRVLTGCVIVNGTRSARCSTKSKRRSRFTLPCGTCSANRRGKTGAGEQMPNAGDARWVLFLQGLATIGVENPAGSRSRKWRDKVRLRYLPDQLCKDCGGSVIKASWAAKTPACLRCRVAPAPSEVGSCGGGSELQGPIEV